MKKLVTLLFAIVLGAGTGAASAQGMIDKAFSDILGGASSSFQDSGTFKSQIRTSHQLGRYSMRFRGTHDSRIVQLFNIQPPSLDVGCNGIDFTLGGFSYVDSAVIEQMIQAIIQGAAMYVIQLALNALCEDCVAELRAVIDKINKATQMLQNDCAWGQQLAALGLSKIGVEQKNQSGQTRCERYKAQQGDAESQIEARSDGFCDGVNKVQEWLKEKTDGKAGTDKNQAAIENDSQMNCAEIGNSTWCALKSAGIVLSRANPSANKSAGLIGFNRTDEESWALGELIMSMVGTTLSGGSAVGGRQLGTLKPAVMLELLMCGSAYFTSTAPSTAMLTPSVDPAVMVAKHCSAVFSTQNTSGSEVAAVRMLMCSPNPTVRPITANTDRFERCDELIPESSSNPTSVKYWMSQGYVQTAMGRGFLRHILDLQKSILDKINTGGPAYTAAEIGLIEAAPFPLYKALNLASVFPEIAADIMEMTGVPLAYMEAAAFFTKTIAQAAKKTEASPVPTEFVIALQQGISDAEQQVSQNIVQMFESMNRITLINQQIEDINAIMLKSLHQRNLMGNASMAADVAALYAPGSVAAP